MAKKLEPANIIAFALVAVVMLGLSYLLVAGLSYGFCWAFDLVWSWKCAFGVWVAYLAAVSLALAVRRPQ